MSGFICSLPLIAALFSDCVPPLPFASGYVEGEYVMIAPVSTARIAEITVRRGDKVMPDQPLARMERTDAEIALSQAEAAMAQAKAALANLLEGARPEEIRAIEASLTSAEAKATEAERTADRQENLAARGAVTAAQLDDARTAATVATAQVAEIEARLAVARLPARPQQIEAARAALAGSRAAREQAKWNLEQRLLTAPAPGTIYDIVRSPGELAGPAAPILSMLPDGAIKLRLYIPETVISLVSLGSTLSVRCDGCPEGLRASVSYVSDAPEFTPPVIYSLENRQKLVYLVEARPEGGTGTLKPGQIVDVLLPGQPE